MASANRDKDVTSPGPDVEFATTNLHGGRDHGHRDDDQAQPPLAVAFSFPVPAMVTRAD
jgi:hypothetical protein